MQRSPKKHVCCYLSCTTVHRVFGNATEISEFAKLLLFRIAIRSIQLCCNCITIVYFKTCILASGRVEIMTMPLKPKMKPVRIREDLIAKMKQRRKVCRQSIQDQVDLILDAALKKESR